MGLFDRFRGKEKVAAGDLGRHLAGMAVDTAFRDENALYSELEDEEAAGKLPVAARIETLIVAAFPFDVMTVGEFSVKAAPVQAALRQAMIEILKAMVRPEYSSRADFSALPALIDQRCEQYATILHTDFSSAALQRFSFAASNNIVGSPDPFLGAKIALHFAMTMKHIAPTLRHYEIG